MSLLGIGIFATLGVTALYTIAKYYKIWYGTCDECGKIDEQGLIKTEIPWNKKQYICHTCLEIYKVVLLGQKIPHTTSPVGEFVSPEIGRRRWIKQWVHGSFFEDKK